MWDFSQGVHACQCASSRGRLQPVAWSLCIYPLGRDTPALTANGPMDRLLQISQQKGAVKAALQAILLLYVA